MRGRRGAHVGEVRSARKGRERITSHASFLASFSKSIRALALYRDRGSGVTSGRAQQAQLRGSGAGTVVPTATVGFDPW